jgi:hypothetical protein
MGSGRWRVRHLILLGLLMATTHAFVEGAPEMERLDAASARVGGGQPVTVRLPTLRR